MQSDFFFCCLVFAFVCMSLFFFAMYRSVTKGARVSHYALRCPHSKNDAPCVTDASITWVLFEQRLLIGLDKMIVQRMTHRTHRHLHGSSDRMCNLLSGDRFSAVVFLLVATGGFSALREAVLS